MPPAAVRQGVAKFGQSGALGGIDASDGDVAQTLCIGLGQWAAKDYDRVAGRFRGFAVGFVMPVNSEAGALDGRVPQGL